MQPIFCPSDHLVLNESRCPQCGWLRSLPPAAGAFVWGPQKICERLGGPGKGAMFHADGQDGVVVFAHERDLLGICLADGRQLWHQTLKAGYVISGLVSLPFAGGSRLLAALCDRRTLLEAQSGALVEVDPASGAMKSLWEPGCPDLTIPALGNGVLALRTSQSHLVLFENQAELKLRWKVPLETWSAMPPLMDGDIIVVSDGQAMQQVGRLCAYQISDGSPVWDVPLSGGPLSHLPAADSGRILVRGKSLEGRSYLAAFNRQDGALEWRQDFKNLYTPALAASGAVYIVRRGSADKTAPDHYLLSAFNAQDGSELWNIPLEGRRANWIQLLDAGTLVLLSDDGRVSGWDLSDQKMVWELAVGDVDNPLQTVPVVSNGTLVAGTYFGNAAAIKIRADDALGDLSCDPEGQAAGLALQGDFIGAAQIYIEQLKQPRKAFALYERAQDWVQAGRAAASLGWYEQARTLFEKAGASLELAGLLETMQDWLKAAEQYVKAGDKPRAAENYERGGELREAMRLYYESGDHVNFRRLRGLVPYSLSDIERMLQNGEREKAAREFLKIGELRRAIALFEELGLAADELSALQQFNERSPERWSRERQVKLARQMGLFILEAETYVALEQATFAAEAYLRAARQAEQRSPDQHENIGNLYILAKALFDQEGYNEEAQQCWAKIILYHQKPWIVLEGHAANAFREEEFNKIELQLTNVGAGVAKHILVRPSGGRFEVDREGTMALIPALAPQKARTIPLFIRPLEAQVGENVPFVLEWHWYDKNEQEYEDQISTPVTVIRRDDSHTGNIPMVIGEAKFFQGTYINGNQVAHQGDVAVVYRGQSSSVTMLPAAEEGGQKQCERCSLPLAPGATFCDGCGLEISQ